MHEQWQLQYTVPIRFDQLFAILNCLKFSFHLFKWMVLLHFFYNLLYTHTVTKTFLSKFILLILLNCKTCNQSVNNENIEYNNRRKNCLSKILPCNSLIISVQIFIIFFSLFFINFIFVYKLSQQFLLFCMCCAILVLYLLHQTTLQQNFYTSHFFLHCHVFFSSRINYWTTSKFSSLKFCKIVWQILFELFKYQPVRLKR